MIFIAGVWLLRAVLLSVRDGDPFTPRTVTRLRALAGVVLIGGPIAFALRSVFETQLAQTAQLPGTGLELTIPGNALLGGLALFVLAEVFAQGVRLRDDLEGTV